MCGQKARPPGYAAPTPSEVAAAGDSTSALLKKTFLRDSYDIEENDLDENLTPEDENNSEVSFNDEENLSEGREDQSSMTLQDAKNIGGGKLLSWGTGY